MNKLIILPLLLFCTLNLNGQTLRGTVKSKHGGIIPKIWVSVLGGDKELTDQTGEFELNISNCKHCQPGNTITLLVFNDDFGFHRINETIKTNLTLLIEVERKPNITGITGTIKDAKTNQLLEGINVKILSTSQANKIPVVKTDKYGTFIIYLKKDVLGPDKYVEFIFSDDKNLYFSKKETKNIAAPFDVLLDKGGKAYDLNINTYMRSSIDVSPGDLILIKATGSIKVGPWVGHSDPNGRTGGFANADLSHYNIVPEFNHAALLYRMSGESEWQYAGKEIEFYAQSSGFLEFEVNDNDQGNNSGAYKVKIVKK